MLKSVTLVEAHARWQTHSATCIFRCAEDPSIRNSVRDSEGLKPLVGMLENVNDHDLIWGASGAVWKCAADPENSKELRSLKAIELLIALLTNQVVHPPWHVQAHTVQEEDVLVNVSGAISALALDAASRKTLRSASGVEPLVNLLTSSNEPLLENVTLAVGKCAGDKENMALIDKLDGVRLLWSLLKSHNPKVQANSAWAICPCIENAKNAGEIVRSFVGGLELIVGLLRSQDLDVLASVCAAIAIIAKDQENLAVITDHGVVPLLGDLTSTTDDQLRQHLSDAIANCCSWGSNRLAFGDADAVAPVVKFLKSKDPLVLTNHIIYTVLTFNRYIDRQRAHCMSSQGNLLTASPCTSTASFDYSLVSTLFCTDVFYGRYILLHLLCHSQMIMTDWC